MFTSTGILRYEKTNEYYRCVLDIDQELADYYRSLVPKAISLTRQRYGAHITVVRPYKEWPTNLEAWGRYEGEEVSFQYTNTIWFGRVYAWLDCYSERLEQIRSELGLPLDLDELLRYEGLYEPPMKPYKKRFHSTIGNAK